MPTIFHEKGFRFFFYSNEGREPCHVHVIGRDGEVKFWVPSCEIAYVYRLSAKDLKEVLMIIRERIKEIEEKWREFFKLGQ